MSDEFNAIAPAPTAVQWKGRTVNLMPLTVGQLPAFARAVRPFAAKLTNFTSLGPMELIDLVADYGEKFIEAISIASGIKPGEINDADPVELVALVAPIIKVNADFFGRRLGQAVTSMAKAMNGDGPTRSSH